MFNLLRKTVLLMTAVILRIIFGAEKHACSRYCYKYSSTETYDKINNLFANDTIDKSIRDPEIKFGIDPIPIENHRLPYT